MIKRYLYYLTLYTILKLAQCTTTEIKWPSGTYGLPEPTTGCPLGWSVGSVYHNTEDDQNINRRSNSSYHLSGVFNSRGIEQTFCMKLNEIPPTNDNNHTNLPWPSGSYCIYKKGECPTNFESGSIFWDDEKSQQDLPNSHEGSIPDGEYSLNSTLIYFCCTKSGSTEQPIELPTNVPFYLFPYGNKTCQKIKGMKSNVEFIFFDDNDEGNRDSIYGAVPFGVNPDRDYNILLYMCYYESSSDDNDTNSNQEISKEIKKDINVAPSIVRNPKSLLIGLGLVFVMAMVTSMVILIYQRNHEKIHEFISTSFASLPIGRNKNKSDDEKNNLSST